MREKVKEYFKDEIKNFNSFVTQVFCDSTGRFFVSKDGRKNNAFNLGKKIFTEDQFIDYLIDRINKEPEKNQIIKDKTITLLVGVPASGKSTWLDENLKSEVVVSRDNTLMDYASTNNISGDYSEVWKQLTDDDQKQIDKILQETFQKAVKERKDIIIDMTNVSRKSRRKWINTVPKDYNKKAVVFATEYDEIYARNEKRFQETGKNIPDFVISNMMKGFMIPTFDEFNEIDWVF